MSREIERLARVLFERRAYTNYPPAEIDSAWHKWRPELEAQVRAILKAMREPSEEAQLAAWKPRDGFTMAEYDRESWQAMIDQILSDPEG